MCGEFSGRGVLTAKCKTLALTRGVTAKITDGRNATVAALLVTIVSATSTPSRTWTLKSESVRHR